MSVSSVSPNANGKYQTDERKELTKRLTAAEQSVVQTEKATREIVDHIREGADKEIAAETNRKNVQIDNLKNKEYEDILNLKRAQQAEINKTRRDGEMNALKMEEFYRDANIAATRQGREHLNEIQKENFHRLEYEQRNANAAEQGVETQKDIRINRLREHADEQLNQAEARYKKQIEDYNKSTEEAKLRAQDHFEDTYHKTMAQTNQTLGEIAQRGARQIKDIKRDTEEKLTIYSSRQHDPFYKLMTFRSRLYEDHDKYTLVAAIPRYEQEHVQASISGNNLIINGYRRDEESLDGKDGRKQQSSSFQSYHETFPLETPADAKNLKQYFSGDHMIIEVPKLKFAYKQPPKPLSKEAAKIELPHFPRSVEYAQDQEKLKRHDDRELSADEVETARRSHGTLA